MLKTGLPCLPLWGRGTALAVDEVLYRCACISHYIKRSASFCPQKKKQEANFASKLRTGNKI